MLATIRRAPVALVRRASHVPTCTLRAIAPRCRLHVRAYQEDATKPQPEHKQEQQLQQQQPGQGSAMTRHDPHSKFGRLPSIFSEMQREMDALTRSFGMWDDDFFMAPLRKPMWDMERFLPADMPTMRLATDVEEDETTFTIKADIPGMNKEDVKLQLMDDTLTITGERKVEKKEGDKDKPSRIERHFGSFMRSFTLPKNVDPEGITATAKDGVLTVVIPKVEEEKPKAKEIPVA